jgi:hypothetical protein
MTKIISLSINTKLKKLLNYQKVTFFIIFIFFVLKVISSLTFYMNDSRTTFELTNSFGGYIESIYLGQGFQSCVFDGHFTIFIQNKIGCNFSTRMPVLPYFYAFLSFFSNKVLFVSLMKNTIMSLIFLYLVRIFFNANRKILKKIYIFNFLLLIIFFSPPVIKHASNVYYEEGLTTEFLILWTIFFLLCLFQIREKNFKKNDLVPSILLIISIILYFTKETMLFCLLLSIAINIIWIIKKFSLKILLAIALSVILLFLWGARNYKATGKYFIGSSINWMLTYYSFNNTSYKIYPEIALDQLFVAKEFILNDGTKIKNNEKNKLKFEDELSRNQYYKEKTILWTKENPIIFGEYIIKKIYNFLIYVKKTPFSIGPDVKKEYFKNPIQEIAILIWLLIGRFCTIILAYLIVKNWNKEKFLCFFIMAMNLSYASPYLLAFSYERHITPFLIMIIISIWALLNIKKINF